MTGAPDPVRSLPSATRLVRSIKEECVDRGDPAGKAASSSHNADSWPTTMASEIIKASATS